MGGATVRDGHRDANIRAVRIGGKGRGTVQNPGITIPYGGGAGSRSVRPGFRFRERPAAQPFPGREFRQVLLLLFFRSVLVDVVGAERCVCREDNPHRTVHPREFFDDDGVLDVPEARPTVRFGKDGPHKAQVT